MSRSLMRSEKGTSIVEFALLAPVFIFMLVGLIEVGRYTYFAILAAHAARAAVQYGAQNLVTALDSTGMTNAALADAANLGWHVYPSHFCVQNGTVVSCISSEPPAGTVYYVSVQVKGTFNSLLNYPGIPSSVNLNSTATMRVASQ